MSIARSFVFLAYAVLCVCGAFVQVPQIAILNSQPFALARADLLGIQYTPTALNSTVSDLPAFALSLDAEFAPNMSQEKFAALHRAYAFSATASRVIYNPVNRYRFTDFLPPLLQATNALHFHTQRANFSLPDVLTGHDQPAVCQSTQLSVNCWGFLFDALTSLERSKLAFTLSVAHTQVAWAVLSDPSTSNFVKSTDTVRDFATNATARNLDLRPGDYVLIFHQNPGDASPYLDRTTTD
jgi:hypothetical protein